VAEAIAEAHPWKQRPNAFDGTVEAISENPPDPIGRLVLDRRALEFLIGLGEGCCTSVLGVAKVPDDTTADNRGQIHFVSQTVTVLFISQKIGGEGQTTPTQYGDETLLSKRADETIERHRREMPDDRTEFQTQSSLRRQQGMAGRFRAQRAIAQDEMREDCEHRATRGALETPDGDPPRRTRM
jgi:hypothetical protein